MANMFKVRSARVLAPTALSWALPACMPHASPPPNALTPPGLYLAPHRMRHARLSTRQWALAFNQPLSFDTSKVTTMKSMFHVRSTRALAPQP